MFVAGDGLKMAKNKKPRKKYTPKNRLAWWKVDSKSLEEISSEFQKLQLIVEIKLPQGKMNDFEFYLLRDFVNWGIIAASTRTWYTEETRAETSAALHDAAVKLTEMQVRGRKNEGRYIAKADELASIRAAFEFLGPFMDESLRDCPVRVVKEYGVMRIYSANAKLGKPVRFHVSELIKAVERY